MQSKFKKFPGFVTPEGNLVSRSSMAKALRVMRKNPDAEYKGWNWYPTSGHFIINAHKKAKAEWVTRNARCMQILRGEVLPNPGGELVGFTSETFEAIRRKANARS